MQEITKTNKMASFKKCQRCGCTVQSFSPMRKWCFDCRKIISLEQARLRKIDAAPEAQDL